MAGDSGQKTEKPTPKRLEKARSDGQFPSSKEFISAAQFLAFLSLAVAFGEAWFLHVLEATRALLARAFVTEVTPQSLRALFYALLLPELVPLLKGGAALVGLVLALQLVTTRLGISTAKLAPDFKRFDILAKMRNLPAQNGPMLLQSLVLLGLVSWVLYYEIRENLTQFLRLPWMSAAVALRQVTAVVKTLLWRAGMLFLLVGLVDLWWQNRRYGKQLRMSKQEVREEAKEQQGNPHMKQRIRRIQRDMARRQMMKEIPNATAVIVNPTHYAVAIRYSAATGGAPKVIAKGKNYLALRIRQKALAHQVPSVENAPLARALFKSADVGQEIPADLYRAVAEILAYIYRLMNGRLPG